MPDERKQVYFDIPDHEILRKLAEEDHRSIAGELRWLVREEKKRRESDDD